MVPVVVLVSNSRLALNSIHCPKVTKMGSIAGHRIDYNGVGVLKSKRHIPSIPGRTPSLSWCGMAVKHEMGPTHSSNYCQSQSLLGLSAQEPLKVPRNSQTKRAYQALVRPHVEYASAVWDPYLIKDVKKVESVQRRTARFVKNNYVKEKGTVTNLLKELDGPPWNTEGNTIASTSFTKQKPEKQHCRSQTN